MKRLFGGLLISLTGRTRTSDDKNSSKRTKTARILENYGFFINQFTVIQKIWHGHELPRMIWHLSTSHTHSARKESPLKFQTKNSLFVNVYGLCLSWKKEVAFMFYFIFTNTITTNITS
ncbi:hypothetical protein POM88_054038 [Heracleum sosnowskyi]|uniref:Uncharacterized protein n=1 Tax=Heracleum sosnowskyi TaxID=360622 RepID=A0AAD8GMZ6_9APIA|nr:hypothetical protein POM88_054038 [Heracleum sosnowskyi]